MDIFDLLRTEVIVHDDEISEHVAFKVKEIQGNNQTFGRDQMTMENHVKSGSILEIGLAKLIDGVVNPNLFDSSDPESFAWDVEKGGVRFEVKSSPKADSWFNFNLHGVENSSNETLTRVNLTTFLKYSSYSNFIIAGYYTESGSGYVVKFKWLMKSLTFQNYVKKSRASGKGTTNYYDIVSSKRNLDCFEL